jgi:hypothetical protein
MPFATKPSRKEGRIAVMYHAGDDPDLPDLARFIHGKHS